MQKIKEAPKAQKTVNPFILTEEIIAPNMGLEGQKKLLFSNKTKRTLRIRILETLGKMEVEVSEIE